MAVCTFEALATQYDAALSTGVNRIIANAITNNAQQLAVALTLYVIVIGYLMCVRKMSWANFVSAGLRAGIISFLITAAAYNTYIVTPAMDTIPTWIAQTTNGSTAIAAGPNQFCLLMSAVNHQEAAILQQASGWTNLGYRLEAAWYATSVAFLLLVGFWIYETSRMIMGLLCVAFLFVLFFYLFEATRSIPLRVAHKALGILILQLLLSITLQLMMTADAFFMQSIASGTGQGLDEQLAGMRDITVFFFFGIAMVSVIPSIAAYIGGGVAISVGGTIMQAARTALSRRPPRR
jgi:hypothetical protein